MCVLCRRRLPRRLPRMQQRPSTSLLTWTDGRSRWVLACVLTDRVEAIEATDLAGGVCVGHPGRAGPLGGGQQLSAGFLGPGGGHVEVGQGVRCCKGWIVRLCVAQTRLEPGWGCLAQSLTACPPLAQLRPSLIPPRQVWLCAGRSSCSLFCVSRFTPSPLPPPPKICDRLATSVLSRPACSVVVVSTPRWGR